MRNEGCLGIALAVIAAGWLAGRVAAEPQPPQPAPPAAREPAPAEKIDKLIRQLGDKDYYVRQRAQDELARLGFEAFEALAAATTDPDPEIASRAKYLLRLMRMEWTSENDPPEVKRYLRDYESLDARARQARMQVLAGLPKGQGTAALCRLVRFEKSSLLSKTAAVALLLQDRDSPPDAATVETIRKALRRLQAARRRLAALLDAAAVRAGSGHGPVVQARRCRAGGAGADPGGEQPGNRHRPDPLPGGLVEEARA